MPDERVRLGLTCVSLAVCLCLCSLSHFIYYVFDPIIDIRHSNTSFFSRPPENRRVLHPGLGLSSCPDLGAELHHARFSVSRRSFQRLPSPATFQKKKKEKNERGVEARRRRRRSESGKGGGSAGVQLAGARVRPGRDPRGPRPVTHERVVGPAHPNQGGGSAEAPQT